MRRNTVTRLGLPGWRVQGRTPKHMEQMVFRVQRRTWWGWRTVRAADRFVMLTWFDAEQVLARIEDDQTKPKGERVFG